MSARHAVSMAMALALSSCAVIPSTTFTEWRGKDMPAGDGGTVRTVDGIEFWEIGTPNRPFRAIGVINDSRNDKPWFKMGMDGTIAKIAKEHGGNAVVLLGANKAMTGINQYNSQIDYRAETKLIVIQYL